MRASIAIDFAARQLTRERLGGQLINAVLGAIADRYGLPTKLRRVRLDAMNLALSEGPQRGARPSHSCTPCISQILARHADPRTTEHYDRARGNLDRHGVHFLTAYVAGV